MKITKIFTILFFSAFVLQAQDITNKLGGDTAAETYDVTDNNDNLLFRVQGDGKVGVGTDTPSEVLDIDGNIAVSGTVDGIDIATDVTANTAKVTDDDDGVAEVYGAGWDTDGEAPTKNDVYDKIESLSGGGTTYSIGDFAQGGIVFWVDETGQHGLVCAKTDQSSAMRWYAGTNGNTLAKGDGPFSGEANTTIIIAAQVAIGDDGATYAARVCNELQITEGGKTYGDWYLPSKQELNLMYTNKATIDATATANSGTAFAAPYYWSSTELSNYYAWVQSLSNGFQYNVSKADTNYVRSVRAF